MVNKKLELPNSRHHIMVFDEDWEFLTQMYGENSVSKIGVGVAIRTIIHQKVKQMKEAAIAKRGKGE